MALPTRGDVARIYDEIAVEYDRARQRPWPEVVEFASSLPPRSLVADLGCGNGRHAKVLTDQGHRVVGLDASSKLLPIARQRASQAGFALGDLCRLPFPRARFSAAIAVATIHHLPSETERLAALREVARILQRGARVLVTAWAFERAALEEGRELRPAGSGPGDVWVPWRAGGTEVRRFYHLFVENELPQLVLRSGLRVERYFRSGDNYVVVAERHG